MYVCVEDTAEKQYFTLKQSPFKQKQNSVNWVTSGNSTLIGIPVSGPPAALIRISGTIHIHCPLI